MSVLNVKTMILVGLIPGPHEPSLSKINHFLRPMVDELLELFEGVTIPTASNPAGELVRCALAMVCCDIPAAKKVSGFTAFNSYVPCHKCSCEFPSQIGTPLVQCFSNVDCDSWDARDKTSNYEQAISWKNAKTNAERKRIEQQYGVRWSELHRLHYFDIVRCTIVDGLHNLYLGTSKKMMDCWKGTRSDLTPTQNYLTTKDLVEMAEEAKKITVPPQFTTLGSKIAANFSGLKGDEYRSWTLVYSAVLLKGRLVGNHMRNWMLFVRANRILSAPAIKPDDIEVAHNLLKQFVADNVELYGENFITPNMHLHLHLHQTIRDFGPIYSTWLYSFERANGDIKEINTNFKDGLEITYMEKYLHHVHLQDYIHILPNIIKSNKVMMDMLNCLLPDKSHPISTTNPMHDLFDLPSFLNNATNMDVILTGTEPLPPSCFPLDTNKITIMNRSHYKCLVAFYASIYSSYNVINITESTSAASSKPKLLVNTCIKKFNQINILGQQFNSLESKTNRGAFIQAYATPNKNGTLQVGRILYFFVHDLTLPSPVVVGKEDSKQHVFAFVQWYEANDTAYALKLSSLTLL